MVIHVFIKFWHPAKGMQTYELVNGVLFCVGELAIKNSLLIWYSSKKSSQFEQRHCEVDCHLICFVFVIHTIGNTSLTPNFTSYVHLVSLSSSPPHFGHFLTQFLFSFLCYLLLSLFRLLIPHLVSVFLSFRVGSRLYSWYSVLFFHPYHFYV